MPTPFLTTMLRRLLPLCVFWLIVAPWPVGKPAWADTPPHPALAAVQRLHDKPDAFDRSDQFCTGKSRGDACSVDGSRLAGGGEGFCQNDINRHTFTIDLSCKREGLAVIQRGLPKGGFVAPASLCDDQDAPSPWRCTPLADMPADRFCLGKSPSQTCTVLMSYDGVPEQHEGICREETQKEGPPSQPQLIATRQVLLCMAAEPIALRYHHAPSP